MSDDERERGVWHVAGHAWAAMTFGFAVRRLDLGGVTDGRVAPHPGAQRLDPWTLVDVPRPGGPPGSFAYAKYHERLACTAIAGPALELFHRGLPCTVERVRSFEVDWRQA